MSKYEIIFEERLSEEHKKDIWDLLVLTDHEFVPSLSKRSRTLQKDLLHLVDDNNQLPTLYYESLIYHQFLLVLDKDRVIGFMSFIPDYKLELDDGKFIIVEYDSTIIVHPDHRSNGITEQMYKFLMNEKKLGRITTKTWSTNLRHIKILNKLGFKNICTIVNDRGEGIDTVYYSKVI